MVEVSTSVKNISLAVRKIQYVKIKNPISADFNEKTMHFLIKYNCDFKVTEYLRQNIQKKIYMHLKTLSSELIKISKLILLILKFFIFENTGADFSPI